MCIYVSIHAYMDIACIKINEEGKIYLVNVAGTNILHTKIRGYQRDMKHTNCFVDYIRKTTHEHQGTSHLQIPPDGPQAPPTLYVAYPHSILLAERVTNSLCMPLRVKRMSCYTGLLSTHRKQG